LKEEKREAIKNQKRGKRFRNLVGEKKAGGTSASSESRQRIERGLGSEMGNSQGAREGEVR